MSRAPLPSPICLFHTCGPSIRTDCFTPLVSLHSARAITPAPTVLPSLSSHSGHIPRLRPSRHVSSTAFPQVSVALSSCNCSEHCLKIGRCLKTCSSPEQSPWPRAHIKDTSSTAAGLSVSQREAHRPKQGQTARQPWRELNTSHMTNKLSVSERPPEP